MGSTFFNNNNNKKTHPKFLKMKIVNLDIK